LVKVFIDPGHGGRDPGGAGNSLVEKNIVLEMALQVAKKLQDYECEVKLSRENDTFFDLGARTQMANDWGADLYFSIHTNAHSNADANGYEDFIHPQAPQRTQQIRDKMHPPMAKVWTDAGRMNRGKKTANFQVLRETRMPAVLVEHGFLTNERDANLLRQQSFKGRVVDSMVTAIASAMELKRKPPVVSGTPILGTSVATISQAKKWAADRNAHQRFIDIADFYWYYGQRFGIRADVMYAQAAHETGYGRYGGVVSPDMNNWAGIKIRQGGSCSDINAHERFPNPSEGVRAHFNHMAAYVGIPPIGTPHGRYHTVMSLSWAGTIKTVEELGGKWAPNPDYGRGIVRNLLQPLITTSAPPVTTPPPGPTPISPQGVRLCKVMLDGRPIEDGLLWNGQSWLSTRVMADIRYEVDRWDSRTDTLYLKRVR